MNNNSELNNNVTPYNVTNQNTAGIPVVSDPTQVSSTPAPTVADPTAVTPSAPALEPTVSTQAPVAETPIAENTTQPDFENRMVNPGVIGDISIKKDNNSDPNGAVNENLKKVEINYTPPSKGKTFALIVFFIFMIAFIVFLPNITTMVNKLKAGKEPVEEKITTGKLICEYNTTTTNLDKDYRLVFEFSDNKLDTLSYNVTTKGDPTEDEKTLDELAERCNNLKDFTNSITGVTIGCDYSEGKLVEKQTFIYANIDDEKLTAAYSEAGGTNPQYTVGQDMDAIETSMNASGYSCKRERN